MSYLKYFTKSIDETVTKRVSCRTFENKLLDEKHKEELLTFCRTLNRGLWGEKIDYSLVECSLDELKKTKMSAFGLFKNVRSFVVAIIDKANLHHISYGYALEHIVLKATELGIGTCWAGYFDPRVMKDIKVEENQTVPAIILVGYAAEKRTLKEIIARFAIRASKRRDWRKLFFHGDFGNPLSKETAGHYAGALEMLRLAPSAGNTQPWRIVKENDQNIYHFFKRVVNPSYEKHKLHDIDIGIAMCHFELGAAKNGLDGKWERTDPHLTELPSKTHYMITWTHDTI
ncbi:MAG: nitroreductase family protein [candidate division WOR-3 bacterium]|nr:nitroreductase family protein [candidate division WOR-3 bacterium]